MCSHVVKHYWFRRESVVGKSAYVDSPAHQFGFLPIASKSTGNSGDSTYGNSRTDRLRTVYRAFCLTIRNALIDRLSHSSLRAQKACVRKWDNRMLAPRRCFHRDRRVAAGNVTRGLPPRPCHAAVARPRRGVRAGAKSIWRRTTTGSNHISAYGVWCDHARRARARVNRTGETRWHRLPAAAMPVHVLCERQ
jgi:hypothetical protein